MRCQEKKKGVFLERNRRIFVAMSGGVDSSVAAALLKKKGYDAQGVFIKGWYPPKIPCTWREDRRDAMRVAALLDIPFYTFDFSHEYKKHVIDYMIKEYKKGQTPNPDIMCNKYIKFDLFLKKSLEMGADKIATGHYIKISNLKSQISKLLIAKDKNKDQSYFLWTLTQEQLKYCLFPVGDYTKYEVRKLAKKFKLPVADKKDSQGLCFVGEFKMEEFLKNYIQSRPGNIINEKGEKIGEHKGIQYYTIGQRRGTGARGQQSYYVAAKDLKNNTLIVTKNVLGKNFYKKEVVIKDVNWISGYLPDTSKKYLGRIRYRQPLQSCHLETKFPNRFSVIFDKPQKAVALSQSLVIYKNNELIGGGVIVDTN